MAKRSRYIPADIAYEILPRLPVKALKRLKSTCKSWSSAISSPQFINNHYLQSLEKPLLLSVRNEYRPKPHPKTILHLSTYDIKDTTLLNNFSKEVPSTTVRINLIQSCRGLVCLATKYTSSILVWNLSTDELIFLPNTCGIYVSIGFGYATSTREFKVFSFFYAKSAEGKYYCHVLTLGKNNWREVNNSPPYRVNSGGAPFLHGALHFLPHPAFCGVEEKDYIAAFNVDTEEYNRISLPNSYRSTVKSDALKFMTLTESGGLLCLTFNLGEMKNRQLELWLLEEYSNEVWVKGYNINLYPLMDLPCLLRNKAQPLAVVGNENILLNIYGTEIWCYNLQDKIVTERKHIGGPTTLFVESLFTL